MAVTGWFSLQSSGERYTLVLCSRGWLCPELVQYLDGVLEAENRPAALLKLLGWSLILSPEEPPRLADHWVSIRLEQRVLESNSELIKKAVRQQQPEPGEPYSRESLQRIYRVLDRFDFTVHLF